MTMAHLAKAIGDPQRQPDFQRYRRIQIYQHLASRGYPLRWRNNDEAALLWKQLSLSEKCEAYAMIALHRLSSRFSALRRIRVAMDRDLAMHAFTPVQYTLNEGDFVTARRSSRRFKAEAFRATDLATTARAVIRPLPPDTGPGSDRSGRRP